MKVRHWQQPNRYKFRRFNSRTREGATMSVNQLVEKIKVSIHAPVKVRQHIRTMLTLSDRFNSRTREGATKLN